MLVSAYSELTLSRLGARSMFMPGGNWGACFRLDADVSELFPYINAMLDSARLFDKPRHVQFIYEGVKCTLYPGDVVAASFESEDHAKEYARKLIEFLNSVHEKKKDVRPDHRKYAQIHVMEVYKLLPRTNCGECGHPTCMAFAAAISNREADTGQCPGFSPPITKTAVYPVYDVDGNLESTVTLEIKKDEPSEAEPAQAQEGEHDLAGLTQREIEVLSLMSEGATNIEISEKLFISPHTVKSHVIHIFNKLGVNDRTQAAVWAAKHGVV